MFNTKEKRERSVGTRLFLKAFRSASPKAAMVRRPQRPGIHGKDRRRQPSEYSQQLVEKQKIKYSYGLREAQLRRLFAASSKSVSSTGIMLMNLLERRLDNVVFRLGLAPSRSIARQVIGHGHIQVNGKRVDIPSFSVRPNDVIKIKENAKSFATFTGLGERLKKFNPPTWLSINPETLEGKMVAMPKDVEFPFDISLVVDYYSRIVK